MAQVLWGIAAVITALTPLCIVMRARPSDLPAIARAIFGRRRR